MEETEYVRDELEGDADELDVLEYVWVSELEERLSSKSDIMCRVWAHFHWT